MILIKKNNLSFVLTAIICVNNLCSCSHKKSTHPDTPTTGQITISADETFKPILDAEIAVFQAIYQYAQIHVVYKPEAEAIQDLLNDSVRLAITARPLNANEKLFFNQKKFFPKEIEIARDGVALIVNKQNRDTLMTVVQVKNILIGKIKNWNQINSNSKIGEITVVFDHEHSSTLRYMTDSVCKTEPLSSTLTALKHNEDVINFVAENANAIGLIGVSWISDRDDSTMLSFLHKVKVVALTRNDMVDYDHCYQPYQAYIATRSYPFVRSIYAVNSEPRIGLASGFTAFLASERGQRIILKSGVLPATQPYRIIQVKKY